MRGLPAGAILSLEQCWALAQRWYRGRLEADWRRPPPNEIEAIFEEVGLGGAFWRL